MSGGRAHREPLPAIPSTHTDTSSDPTFRDGDHLVTTESQQAFEDWMQKDERLRRWHWESQVIFVKREETSGQRVIRYLYMYFPPMVQDRPNRILKLYHEYQSSMYSDPRMYKEEPLEAEVTPTVQALFFAQGHLNTSLQIISNGYCLLGNEFLSAPQYNPPLEGVWVNNVTRTSLLSCVLRFKEDRFKDAGANTPTDPVVERYFNATLIQALEKTGYHCDNEQMAIVKRKNQFYSPLYKQDLLEKILNNMTTFKIENGKIKLQHNPVTNDTRSQEDLDAADFATVQRHHNKRPHYGAEHERDD